MPQIAAVHELRCCEGFRMPAADGRAASHDMDMPADMQMKMPRP